MSAPRPRPARRGHRTGRSRRRSGFADAGFSLIEVLVAMAILAAVIPISLIVARNLNQQTQNIGDTVLGTQQDQTAGQALYPYLRATTTVLGGSNGLQLNAFINFGFDKLNAISNQAVLTSSLDLGQSGNDATLVTTLTPPNQATKSVGTYYAENPTGDPPTVFTYYAYDNGTIESVPVASLIATPSSTVPGALEYTQVVAVGVDITFLAGPQKPLAGFASVQPSHFSTTIYLENSTGLTAPRTSLQVILPNTMVDGEQSYIVAAISPPPNVGTVAFTLTAASGLGTPITACSASIVLDGVATCQFEPLVYGEYHILAQYSPPSGNVSYLPSSGQASAEIYIPTVVNFSENPLSVYPPGTTGSHTYLDVSPGAGLSGVPYPNSGTLTVSYYSCPLSASSTTTSTNAAGQCGQSMLGSADTDNVTGTGSSPGVAEDSPTFLSPGIVCGQTLQVIVSYDQTGNFLGSPPTTGFAYINC